MPVGDHPQLLKSVSILLAFSLAVTTLTASSETVQEATPNKLINAFDPLIYQEHQVIAPDSAAGDWFGAPVALSGDTALVGAPCDNVNGVGAVVDDVGENTYQGSAYFYVPLKVFYLPLVLTSAP